jgi:16S rRNA processing protein RimM
VSQAPTPRDAAPPARLVVGRIVKPHGVGGEVVVDVMSDAPGRFEPGIELATGDPEAEEAAPPRQLVIAASRRHQGRLLIGFEGLDDRDDAEALRGELLTIPFSSARQLGPDEFWPHQLTGLAVVDHTGAAVGSVTDVLPGAAHDLLQVGLDTGGEVLVPAVAALVTVELAAGRVVVADLPGLLEP